MVKRGFSLAEALVVMAVVSILFSALAKVITTKPRTKEQANPHGYYECYIDGGELKQHYALENGKGSTENAGARCTFKPQTGVAFYNINEICGSYYSGFEPNINNTIYISFSGDNKKYIRSESSESGSIILEYDDGSVATDKEIENIKTYFKYAYPESKIYNNGSYRCGLMISW